MNTNLGDSSRLITKINSIKSNHAIDRAKHYFSVHESPFFSSWEYLDIWFKYVKKKIKAKTINELKERLKVKVRQIWK